MDLVKGSKPSDDEFFRALIFPEEHRPLFTTAKWSGGHRWFRSENVVCIEHYRRQTQTGTPQHAPVRGGRRGSPR